MERKMNFELFRVAAMLLIIAHHILNSTYNIQLNLTDSNYISPLNTANSVSNYYMALGLDAFCIIGVNCFFLISGYFGIHFRLNKLVYLICDLYIVSGLIRFIGFLMGEYPSCNIFLREIINPFSIYWFITVYLLMYVFSPCLNIVVDNISKSTYCIYIFIILFLFDTYGWLTTSGILGVGTGYGIVHAISLYILGRAINKYPEFSIFNWIDKSPLKRVVLFWICNIFYIYIAYFVLDNHMLTYRVYSYNSIINVLLAISFFMMFKNIDNTNKKILLFTKWSSPSILAVYYLHSSSWITLYRNMPIMLFDNISRILAILIWTPIVFIICICIDKIKLHYYSNHIYAYCEHIKDFLNNRWESICNKCFAR